MGETINNQGSFEFLPGKLYLPKTLPGKVCFYKLPWIGNKPGMFIGYENTIEYGSIKVTWAKFLIGEDTFKVCRYSEKEPWAKFFKKCYE